MTRIAVVDHGAGNLVSAAQGLARSGADVVVADDVRGLTNAAGVVLPGVGAADATMARLEASGFADALKQLTVPLLGICVGFQVLFEGSDEGTRPGLGLLPGRVHRLRAPRLPHIGWNDVRFAPPVDELFAGIADGTPFYFVHSFAPAADESEVVIATAEHGGSFGAAARAGSVCGVQFHPERSGPSGLRLLANFVATCREEAGRAA